MAYDPRAYQARVRQSRLAAAKAKGRHTRKEWLALKEFYGNRCLICLTVPQPPYVWIAKDHVFPIALGGCDCIGNIQPLCNYCNSKKGSKDLTDYRQIVKEIFGLDGEG